MAIDDGPRNGDYVAYLEALSRRGSGPGQTLQELDSGASWRHPGAYLPEAGIDPAGRPGRRQESEPPAQPLRPDPPRPAPAATPRPAADRGWKNLPQVPPAGTDAPPKTGNAPYTPYTPRPQADAGPDAAGDTVRQGTPPTLAGQQAQRRASLGMLAVGAVIGLIGANMLLTGLAADGGDPVPGIFLLAFALIFMRGAWKQRRKAAGPLPKLPPLTTISRNPRR